MADNDFQTLGDIVTRVRSLINRRDCTRDLVVGFVNEAQSNLERVLRIGCMERTLQATLDGKTAIIPVTSQFLQVINVFTDHGELIQVDMDEFLKTSDFGGIPRVYVRVANSMHIKPTPAEGVTIYFHHYAQSATLRVDTDRNVWTASAFSALVYTAAELIADHFQDDGRAARFQAKSRQYIDELISQDLDEKFAGPLRIRPPAVDF